MKTVLCIDDALLVRNEMKKILDKKGISILTAENGRQALEVLGSNKDVGLIFCDMNMPEMNGLEFCRNFFENPEWKTIPLFMLTTESDQALKEESKKYFS